MNFKKILTYFLFFLTLLGIIALNFFKEIIYINLYFLPPYFVENLSVLLAIVILIIFIFKDNESDVLKSEVMTVITHKFRTPLSGIKWAVSSLQKDITFTEKESLLREINIASDKLIEIVNLLVGLNKYDEKQDYVYVAVAMREMVQNSLNKYADKIKEKKVYFNIEPSNELPMIIIDKVIFQFVIDTLFDNAIKYTPENGKINVSFKSDYTSLTLVVSDTGIGISFWEMRRLFKMFNRGERAKIIDTEGLGLSLYAAKTIVEKHGGNIWAQSKGKDEGATFFVRIPKAR
ncbi:MAG: ATP-binding protein [Candidatus Paceibacterota bacterium]|jgi:K+-sensing histidine kinase KdpD